jgi:hypothetical protein
MLQFTMDGQTESEFSCRAERISDSSPLCMYALNGAKSLSLSLQVKRMTRYTPDAEIHTGSAPHRFHSLGSERGANRRRREIDAGKLRLCIAGDAEANAASLMIHPQFLGKYVVNGEDVSSKNV